MHLDIAHDMTIEDVQRKFNCCYPFLKIELCAKRTAYINKPAHAVHSAFCFALLTDLLYNKELNQYIQISRQMTVQQLKEILQLAYKVDVRIFRRSGNVWVETSLTNKWTLEEQNRQGAWITSQLYK